MKKLHQTLSWASMLLVIPALVSFTNITIAQEDEEEEEVFELSPFEVDASEDMGYYASQTLAGGRLSTEILNTGSSIEVVTSDFMDDIGASDIQTLLQYTTNTEVGGVLGNYTGSSIDTATGQVDSTGARRNPDANSRIRGLASPDRTRDFFKTNIPFDQYNTGRVDINRGSNSFLFGLGSPAGLINNQLAKALFNDRNKFRFRIGSGGNRPSWRTELDINKVIWEDKLAIRITGLINREQYRQRPTYRNDDRIYGTLTYHPFDNNKRTTIRAHWESGDMISNPAENVLPNQNLDNWVRYRVPINTDLNQRVYRSHWGPGFGDINNTYRGRPRFDVIAEIDAARESTSDPWGHWARYELRSNGRPDRDTYERPGLDLFSGIGGSGYMLIYDGRSNDASFIMRPNWNNRDLNYVSGDRGWNRPNINGERIWVIDTEKPGDPWWSLNGQVSGNSTMRFYSNTKDNPERGVGWYTQGFTNLDTFDFTKQILSGENDFWESKFYNYNASISHVFLDGKAGIDVAYDYQYSTRFAHTFLSNPGLEINIDINQTIPQPQIDANGNVIYPEYDPVTNYAVVEDTWTGPGERPVPDYGKFVKGGSMPNPNFGRPVLSARRGTTNNRQDLTTLRATAYYKLNFEEYSGDDGWLRWLGQHTFSLLGDHHLDEFEGFGNQLRSFASDFDVATHVWDNSGTSVVASPRQVGAVAYLGPPVQDYLGHEVWNPNTPLSLSDIILEPANYDMTTARFTPGYSKEFMYWNKGGPDPSVANPIKGTEDWIGQTIDGEKYYHDEGWAKGTLTPRLIPNEDSQIRRTEVDSWAINAQSFFFNRHLVINTGYREDYIDSWLNREAPKSGEEQIPSVDPEDFRPEDGDYNQINKGPGGKGTFGYGAVLHWPKNIIRIPQSMDVSFHYNYSKNFVPDTSRRTIGSDITVIRLLSPQGESEDYGVTFQLFDRRLIVRLNWYSGTLDGADSSVGNIFNRNLRQMFNWYGNNYQDITYLDSSDGTINGTYDGVISNLDAIDDQREEQLDENGDEIPLRDEMGNIVPQRDSNGDILYDENGDPIPEPLLETDQMVIDRYWPNWEEANQAFDEMRDILFSGYWQIKEARNRVRQFPDGQIEQENVSGITDTESLAAKGFEATVTWNPTRNWRLRLNVARQETVKSNIAPRLERFMLEDWLPWVLKYQDLNWPNSTEYVRNKDVLTQVQDFTIEYFTVKSLEGFPSDEVREWRVNMVTNYSFRDGPLDGFSVGGAIRWQDAAAIGYPLIQEEVLPGRFITVGDVNNAYYGDESFSLDLQCGYSAKIGKYNWQIQLNLRNLQNLNSDNLEPLVAQPDGSYARVRWEPPFEFRITNTFRW